MAGRKRGSRGGRAAKKGRNKRRNEKGCKEREGERENTEECEECVGKGEDGKKRAEEKKDRRQYNGLKIMKKECL